VSYVYLCAGTSAILSAFLFPCTRVPSECLGPLTCQKCWDVS
jgi:hypothetical protein